jgi:restriction system protein
MARRKKTTPAEDLIDVVAMLPWWAGIGLAIVLYLVLHRIAAQPVATSVQPGQIGTTVTQTMWRSIASVGQYLLPLLCLAGAGFSAWKRHERQALVTNVVQSKAADVLDGMSWQQFELLVGEAFRLQGYAVAETGGGGADGGVDLVLTRNGEKFLVQCKQWKAFKVGVNVVRELYGVMAATGAAGGFVVTSGRYTEEATNFASGRNVKLVDGPRLHALIQQARGARGATHVNETAVRPKPAAAGGGADASQLCPLCSKPMVKRLARRGPNAGGEFWGCTGYPGCKGTRNVE